MEVTSAAGTEVLRNYSMQKDYSMSAFHTLFSPQDPVCLPNFSQLTTFT